MSRHVHQRNLEAVPTVAEFEDLQEQLNQARQKQERDATEAAEKQVADGALAARLAEAERQQREKDQAERRREAERRQAADMATQREKQLAAWRELSFDGVDTKTVDSVIESDGRIQPTDIDLCAFDIEHLVSPQLSFACVPGPHASPLRVEAERDSQRTDAASDATWVVTTDVLEELSGRRRPRVVCRLVAKDGRLLLRPPRTPDQPLSTEDHAFTTLQNSLLRVAATDPESEAAPPTIRRTIGFATPVPALPLTLDPLTGRREGDFDPTLARRIKNIDPASLRWDFELTHPEWPQPKHLRFPDTTLTLVLPEGGLPLAYTDVDEKGQIVQRQGNLRIDAVVTFLPEKAELTIDTTLNGLDEAPVFKAAITLDRLVAARDVGDTSMHALLPASLQQRWSHGRIESVFFTAFLRGSPEAMTLGILDAAAFERLTEFTRSEREKIQKPMPDTPERRRDYERAIDPWIRQSGALRMIKAAFDLEERDRIAAEAGRAVEAIDDLVQMITAMAVRVGVQAVAHDPDGVTVSIVLAAP